VRLGPGDWALLYTDGVNEAQDSEGREFGMERFLHLVAAGRDLSSQDLVAKILEGHADFVRHAPQFDDITLIAVKWSGKCADIDSRHIVERTNVA
jgi:sigma-B regulation protein RsbU (phosphoserine phosphatase)